MLFIDKKLKHNLSFYIIQSIYAFISVGIILYILDVLTQAAIVASLASSVFIVFAMPHTYTARPRCLIGGHAVGVICGLACVILVKPGLDKIIAVSDFTFIFTASLAVALSIFIMCITDTEHAPAAGTALGLVINSWSYKTIIFIILGTIFLSLAKVIFGKRLKNLV